MPAHADAPVRRLASSGSTNALFRLGDDLLVRLPRQPGGSAAISKEAAWLPVLGPLLPVSVPDVVAVFEPDRGYPERWSVVRWIEGAHPEVVDPDTSVDPRREDLAKNLAAVLRALQQAEFPWGRRQPAPAVVPRRAARDDGRGDAREHRALPVPGGLRVRPRRRRAGLG